MIDERLKAKEEKRKTTEQIDVRQMKEKSKNRQKMKYGKRKTEIEKGIIRRKTQTEDKGRHKNMISEKLETTNEKLDLNEAKRET